MTATRKTSTPPADAPQTGDETANSAGLPSAEAAPAKPAATTVQRKSAPVGKVKASAKTAPKAKAAAKPATKTAPSPAVKSPAKPKATSSKGKTAAKPLAKAAVKAVADKPIKLKKPKLVRDSFTIPKAEYVVLDELKARAAKLAIPVKKSELLRAGIKALAAMGEAAFAATLGNVPAIKTGRPKLAKA